MKTRQLGNSDLYITPIGFGAWAIGGSGWEFAWGAQDDRDSVAAIREALDKGINWIDTAAVYGLGHSEEVVARALEGMGNRPYVFTKCSMVWDAQGKIGHSLKAESIRRECEASLRRLKVDALDLYQVHWPMPDEEIEEGWATMARLKEEPGKDLVVLGSGELVQSLMRRNLVDEYVLLIHPLILGSGRRLFTDGGAFAALRLVDTKTTTTGVVIATYQSAEPAARKTTDAATH